MYGVINSTQIVDTARYVCEVLGNGANNKALDLLLETARAETSMGKTKDRSKNAGMGLTQVDKGTFVDILERVSFADSAVIQEKMNINLTWILWEDLRYNVLLAFLFTRLKYKKIPEEIPINLEGRAIYWKQFYNSYAKNAKGTVGHYLEANKRFLT